MTARALAAGLGLAVGLAACTAPPAGPGALPPDNTAPCPARLADGQRCTALVHADRWQSATGIQVQPGEAYCLQVAPGQAWVDWFRPHTPPHGDAGNWLMQRVNHWKRHPDSDWFALMAGLQPADAAAVPVHQDLSRAPLVRAGLAGALVLYPNDAVSPLGDPRLFYRNNGGWIMVSVQRCDTACVCPTPPAP